MTCRNCARPVRERRPGDPVTLMHTPEWVHDDGTFLCSRVTLDGFTFAYPAGMAER